jgi:hypothetical protein
MDIIGLLIQIGVAIVVLSPVLWLVGRSLAGKHNAKFTDAIWIVALGTIIGSIVGAFIGGIVASIIMFLFWLGLIKHFFDCSWFKAFAIAVVAVVVFVTIILILVAFLLTLIGIGNGVGLVTLIF